MGHATKVVLTGAKAYVSRTGVPPIIFASVVDFPIRPLCIVKMGYYTNASNAGIANNQTLVLASQYSDRARS